LPVADHSKGDGDFEALFGVDSEPSAAAARRHADDAPSKSPAKKAVAAVSMERSTSANRLQQNSGDRSLSAKRVDSHQQQRPSSAKSSLQPAVASGSSHASARPASAPAATRAAAGLEEQGLDASATVSAEVPANASQVIINRIVLAP
jgi:hypothetical protein